MGPGQRRGARPPRRGSWRCGHGARRGAAPHKRRQRGRPQTGTVNRGWAGRGSGLWGHSGARAGLGALRAGSTAQKPLERPGFGVGDSMACLEGTPSRGRLGQARAAASCSGRRGVCRQGPRAIAGGAQGGAGPALAPRNNQDSRAHGVGTKWGRARAWPYGVGCWIFLGAEAGALGWVPMEGPIRRRLTTSRLGGCVGPGARGAPPPKGPHWARAAAPRQAARRRAGGRRPPRAPPAGVRVGGRGLRNATARWSMRGVSLFYGFGHGGAVGLAAGRATSRPQREVGPVGARRFSGRAQQRKGAAGRAIGGGSGRSKARRQGRGHRGGGGGQQALTSCRPRPTRGPHRRWRPRRRPTAAAAAAGRRPRRPGGRTARPAAGGRAGYRR
jgi:hypothetical protein